LPEFENDGYKGTTGEDLLVLPSKKRETKFKKVEGVTRILSKKQRKKLEKIVEKKKKKENVRISSSLQMSSLFH
jgi:ATP-dependent RNA helicase DHX37/DHR1